MGEIVAFKSKGGQMSGYLTAPPKGGPGIIALEAPVLGFYAGKDGFVTPDIVAGLDAQLTSLGKRHEFHSYPNAQHAFFNDTRPEVYDAGASADAWSKTLAFVKRELA